MKRAPSPAALTNVDVAAHRARQPARDGEAEAGAAALLGLLEPLENPLLVGLGDARPFVGHGGRGEIGAGARSDTVTRLPGGEWRTALPSRLTRIWMTARGSPVAASRSAASSAR